MNDAKEVVRVAEELKQNGHSLLTTRDMLLYSLKKFDDIDDYFKRIEEKFNKVVTKEECNAFKKEKKSDRKYIVTTIIAITAMVVAILL